MQLRKQYKNVMIDTETLGIGMKAPVISIGAILFNLEDQDSPQAHGPSLYLKILLESAIYPGSEVHGDTIRWWASQGESAKQVLSKDGTVRLTTAVDELYCFLKGHEITSLDNPFKVNFKLWTNGPANDSVWLKNAFLAESLDSIYSSAEFDPWIFQYNADRDLRTIKDLAVEKVSDLNLSIRVGTFHNALDDALSQILIAQRCWRAINDRMIYGDRKGEAVGDISPNDNQSGQADQDSLSPSVGC